MSESVAAGGEPRIIQQLLAENQTLRERLERREQELLAANRLMAQVLDQNVARQEALERRTQQLEAVAAMDKALARVMDPQQVLELALDKALEVLAQTIASIYLVEGEGLVLKAHRGFTPEVVAQLGRLQPGQGLAGRVLRSGEPCLVDDIVVEKGLELPITGNIRGAAVVPLKWQGRTIGTMTVASSTVGSLAPEELSCLVALSAPVSFFIVNAHQNVQFREKIEELALLTELSRIISAASFIEPVYESFIGGLKRIADIALAFLVVVEGQWLRIVALYSEVEAPLGPQDTISLEGPPAELLSVTDQTFYQPDLEQERRFWTDEYLPKIGIRSNIHFPLRHQAKFVGYLTLCSRAPHAYDNPRLRQLLAEAASVLAPALAHQMPYLGSGGSTEKPQTRRERGSGPTWGWG